MFSLCRCYSLLRPDGDHGDAAENKKKIGDHDVAQFVEEYMNDIIFI